MPIKNNSNLMQKNRRQITVHLGNYLPVSYEQALDVIDQVVAGYPAGHCDYALIFFPDFVEVYGQDERHWDLSISALERYPKSHSFADLSSRIHYPGIHSTTLIANGVEQGT